MEDFIELQGFITFYKFQNEENNYRVALFKIDDNSQERIITIVGYFPPFKKGESLYLKGILTSHKKYGLQVEVTEIYQLLPTSEKMVIRYLSSNLFPCVGKKCAEKIYALLKEETISVLINQPDIYEQLLQEGIISEQQKESLQNGLRQYEFSSSAVQLLLKYGLSLKNIMKIEALYKDQLQKVLDTNPYQIIVDIEGIGFKTIDKLALNMHIEPTDIRRIKAAILYTLQNLSFNSGDTYVDITTLYRFLKQLIVVTEDKFLQSIAQLQTEGFLIQEDNNYYHYKLYHAEKNIALKLKPYLRRNFQQLPFGEFLSYLKEIEEKDFLVYSQEQIQALYEATSHGFFIITGGPGTGKTTILNALIPLFEKIYGEKVTISLCAPTGRASKRMSCLSNRYACTIHRLLKWDLHSNRFSMNEENPLHTDILIIDEFSMVDTLLFEAVLKGITDVSQIIVIGDDQQLPSVGAGNLLHDFLSSEFIPRYHLKQIFRQSNGSGIVELAHRIRNNQFNFDFHFQDDVHFYQIVANQAPTYICKTLKQAFDSGLTFEDIQVIVPMYAGVSGIDNINKMIQDTFNPSAQDKPELRITHQIIRLGDRVLQLKNQPDDDIFNGDIGVVIDIDLDNEELVVDFDGKEVIYTRQTLNHLTLAYAISVHKAQGSEFPWVIFCVFSSFDKMLNKPLLYTGISRAKKSLLIFGDYQTFVTKSNQEEKNIRKTTLTKRIIQIMEK